jgi:hypothetical protein
VSAGRIESVRRHLGMHRIAVAVFLTLGASSVCAQTKVVVPLPRTSEEIAYIRATCSVQWRQSSVSHRDPRLRAH